MNDVLKTPFPWFGGKSKAANLIWSRLGSDCKNYIEPFFGSGAVLLNRPDEYAGWITVNDLDGHVANLWRAMQSKPEEVAKHACNPVNEVDLHARHLWLVNNAQSLTARLMADPEYSDARAAGWWAWGACCWIGHGWCSGNGPWGAVDVDGVPEFRKVEAGRVNRQLPAIGNAAGVLHRAKVDRTEWLTEWFTDLSTSLSDARICCGDWTRLMSVGSMTRNGVCGVLLDPPYSLTDAVYTHDSKTVSSDCRRWCIENANNPKLRIALCGHDGEHNELEAMGWTVETWNKSGGYQGADDRERIWFSPHCKKPNVKKECLTLDFEGLA